MTEQRKNSFEQADLQQIIDEIEEQEADIASIMGEAMGRVGGVRKTIVNLKTRAREDLKIPGAILSAALKTRKLERQLQKVADSVPDDLAEVWEESSGQFSMFAPANDDEPATEAPSPAQRAARKRKAEADANQQQEQREGAEVLETLTGGAKH